MEKAIKQVRTKWPEKTIVVHEGISLIGPKGGTVELANKQVWNVISFQNIPLEFGGYPETTFQLKSVDGLWTAVCPISWCEPID